MAGSFCQEQMTVSIHRIPECHAGVPAEPVLELHFEAETAAQVLPEGYGYEFGGMSREEAQTGILILLISEY